MFVFSEEKTSFEPMKRFTVTHPPSTNKKLIKKKKRHQITLLQLLKNNETHPVMKHDAKKY